MLITKSDMALHNSDHSALSSDMLLECGAPETLEGLEDSLLDSDETAFMDLFTESESSQDTENAVRGCLLPTTHLIHNLGYVACNFHIWLLCSR